MLTQRAKLYNLEERTLEFSKKIIYLAQTLTKNSINFTLIDQLVRSATSIGANYREANETDTKKDFRNRIRIAKKEAKETKYWLELVLEANLALEKEIRLLIDEADELMKILASIFVKAN